jgi:hypothetical protein
LDRNQFPNSVQNASKPVGSDVVITAADPNDSITLHDVSLGHLNFDTNHFELV